MSHPRNHLVTALMILLGFPLLLPGVCSYFFARAGMVHWIGLLGFLISIGGAAMIGCGIRRLVAPPAAVSVSENAKLTMLLVLLILFIVIGVVVLQVFGIRLRN